jgi:Brp/Blh family beta-carotene 15,15'-monooxygenase
MHAASVIVLAWACIGAACIFFPGNSWLIAVVLATLIAGVGLPHGAADHRFARCKMEPVLGAVWLPVFLGGYLVTGLLVIGCWYRAPAATVVTFFLASAWHFGQEEPRPCVGPRWLRQLLRFARGGLPIWVPLLFQRDAVVRVLSMTAPSGLGNRGELALGFLTSVSIGMFVLAIAGWMLQGVSAVLSRGRKRRALLLDNMLTASLAVLFASVSPLIGFLVYFCGWHSARGLIAVLGWGWFESAYPTEALIRTTFVGLSAVAIPHLLLHGICPFLSHWGGQWKAQPLLPGRLV